ISRAGGEEIDAIARSVLQAGASGKKMIAVTGCRRGEGRTTLLQCVAQALRGSGAAVALVDADVHRPVLAERLGVPPEIGWDDVLLGTRQLPEALVCSDTDRLTLLPRRRPLSGKDESLQRTKQEVIFRMVRDSVDVVLLDTGPLLEDPDCGALWLADCDLIDAAIVVCDPHRNCQRRLSRVLAALEQRQVPPAGVVENFAVVATASGKNLRHDSAGE
ncbi:MAG: P-loop NTPase, partial [Planctomycetes bacterium]|nr:P-loop NTPase [Planctomycetota bacterium]